MEQEYTTNNSSETKTMGKILAEEILKTAPRIGAFVVGLKGNLGSGKTTFLKGFARGLKVRAKILSPTFVIIKKFKIPKSQFQTFYHIDCYRIEKPKEVLKLGFKEIISNPRNIVAIEWADKIRKIIPPKTMILEFKLLEEKKRIIILKVKNEK